MPATSPDELLTETETAAILRVKPQTLTTWRCRRTVPLAFVKVGGSVRYRRSQIDAFISARTVSPAKAGPEAGTR